MPTSDPPLDQLARKLSTRAALSDADRGAILALPFVHRTYHATTYVIREGERFRDHCAFVRSGFAFRQKLSGDGGRQIVSLHLPGDFLDLQNLFLNINDHSVQALTELETIGIERRTLQELALARPAIGRALWIDSLVEAAISREWVLNVGRRDARARIAHVLCEMALRMKVAGIGTDSGVELPLTQEQLGDVVGLTAVHVNRTLKSLQAEGVVYRDKRFIGFSSWRQVAAIGDFNPLYLHLDQAKPA